MAPKRIIIRQGHVAENFYFVLSGHGKLTQGLLGIKAMFIEHDISLKYMKFYPHSLLYTFSFY